MWIVVMFVMRRARVLGSRLDSMPKRDRPRNAREIDSDEENDGVQDTILENLDLEISTTSITEEKKAIPIPLSHRKNSVIALWKESGQEHIHPKIGQRKIE